MIQKCFCRQHKPPACFFSKSTTDTRIRLLPCRVEPADVSATRLSSHEAATRGELVGPLGLCPKHPLAGALCCAKDASAHAQNVSSSRHPDAPSHLMPARTTIDRSNLERTTSVMRAETRGHLQSEQFMSPNSNLACCHTKTRVGTGAAMIDSVQPGCNGFEFQKKQQSQRSTRNVWDCMRDVALVAIAMQGCARGGF